jgi:hypothetical protein
MKINYKIKNLKNLIVKSNIQIFEEQFMYGHRELLLNYSGLAAKNQQNSNLILEAGLQHGWLSDAGIFRSRGKDFRIKPRFVWNKRWECDYPKMEANQSIGAPWLYLVHRNLLNYQQIINGNQDSVLVFPSHSVLGIPNQIKPHIKKFNKIASGFQRKIVCLYWVDFVNPEIYSEFLGYGFEIYCAGFGNPRGEEPHTDDAGRSTYLINLLQIFLKCGNIITDEIQSGVFYALSIGMKLHYFPDETRTAKEIEDDNKHEIFGLHHTTKDWINDMAPEFLVTRDHPLEFQELALNELGLDCMLSKTQVSALPWKKSDISPDPLMSYVKKFNSNF